MADLTHFDAEGNAVMVDVSDKNVTERIAVAEALVHVQPETMRLIVEGGVKKGDVIGVAQLAGIMGAKRTPDLIPLCHPLNLSSVNGYVDLRSRQKLGSCDGDLPGDGAYRRRDGSSDGSRGGVSDGL